jgi:hypothetical protein
MSQQTRPLDVADLLLTPRSTSGRWVYLVAMLFPVLDVRSQLLSPFPIHGYGIWVSAALLLACALQFYRPRLVSWLPVFGWYAWATVQTIWREIEAFQDMGSEDHSRWEGWETEWMFLAFTMYLALLTVCLALQIRRKPAHAT